MIHPHVELPFAPPNTAASSYGDRSLSAETPLPLGEAGALRCVAKGVKKAFGANPILRGVDLSIPEGAFAVLVGPSGCGKSTLLRVIAGLESVDEGTVRLADRDVTALPPGERDVAMVFQSYALYPHLTVRENLAFGLRLRGTPKDEIDARIRDASAMLSLDALLTRFPKQLSGGQRQRVAMGRAIVRRPTLFLFDEPLSNLDAALRAEVRVEIRRLHDRLKATTLYVTHDQVEAMTLADTLWVMNGGHVEQSGRPLDIYERPRTKFVAGFLGSPQMNFWTGIVREREGARVVEADGISVPVPEDRFSETLTTGQKATIGIRPHDFALATEDHGHTQRTVAHLHVELVEALGFEAFAHGRVADSGGTVVMRLDAKQAKNLRTGDSLPLTVNGTHVHLFDATTGRALSV